MPNILELWKAGNLGKGTIVGIPIEKREVKLPSSLTGAGEQAITTDSVFQMDGKDVSCPSCMCTSTGVLYNNCQLILIGEALPIKIRLDAYVGAMNGTVAINMACATLLSRPKQLISARCINSQQYKKYNRIAVKGQYEDIPYWIDDYFSMCTMEGRQISGGVAYTGWEENLIVGSSLYEIIVGKDAPEEPIYFGETYTRIIKPVFYVDIRNPALELEKRRSPWFVIAR